MTEAAHLPFDDTAVRPYTTEFVYAVNRIARLRKE
jgi:hypothetical protein